MPGRQPPQPRGAWGEAHGGVQSAELTPLPPVRPPQSKLDSTSPPTAPFSAARAPLPPVRPLPGRGGRGGGKALSTFRGAAKAVMEIELHDPSREQDEKFAMIPADVQALIRAARIHPDEVIGPNSPRIQVAQRKVPAKRASTSNPSVQAAKRVAGVMGLMTGIVFLGMLIFASIEMEAEDTARAEYSAYMLKV
eukprot:COSAG05_NODE_1039_length_6069_cov_34.005999_1_plen_194_part_00